MDFINMQQHRLFIEERVLVEVEVLVPDHALGFHKLALQKFCEDSVLSDDVRIPCFGVEYDLIKYLLDLTFEILLSDFFNLIEVHFILY